MRARALPLVLLLSLSGPAYAQVTWQPTPPPLVTAENEPWFLAGDAIEWNGAFYYPAGAPEPFNRYQMVRSGSYRGIPLYTDTTLEPNSIVFVPIDGGRMQPYELPRTGRLAGSVGSRAPSFPTGAATAPSGALSVTAEGYVAQAPAPPTFARAYDLGEGPQPMSPAVPIVTAAPTTPTGTAGASVPRPSGMAGRVTNITSNGARPKGINSVWIEYGGRRWISAGKAVDLTSDFAKVGEYRGSPVYQRRGDSLTIYVPMTQGLVAPFKPRGL